MPNNLAYIAWIRAPERLPVKTASVNKNTKINKNLQKRFLYECIFRSTFEYLKLLLNLLAWKELSKTKEKIDLQDLIHFLCYRTNEFEYLDYNIALYIKNKSGKRRLRSGGGWSCNIPPDPCVCIPFCWIFFWKIIKFKCSFDQKFKHKSIHMNKMQWEHHRYQKSWVVCIGLRGL